MGRSRYRLCPLVAGEALIRSPGCCAQAHDGRRRSVGAGSEQDAARGRPLAAVQGPRASSWSNARSAPPSSCRPCSRWPTGCSRTGRSRCSARSGRSRSCSWWSSRAAPAPASSPMPASTSSAAASSCSAPSCRPRRSTAVVAMGLVGFVVLFAGIVAPQAATAATAALLTFVLPVSVAAPASAVGPRLVGWTLAAAFCITACLVVWPAPWHDNLRRRLAAAVSAVARLADARARGASDPEAEAAVTSELARLREQFSGTPYPPTGAASGARRALQAGGPDRMGRRQHGPDRRRALVDGAAPGAGGHGEGGRDAAADGGPHLRRRRPPGRRPRAHPSGPGLDAPARPADRCGTRGRRVVADTTSASLPEGPVPGATRPEPSRATRAWPARWTPGSTRGRSASPPRWSPTAALEAAGAEPVVDRRMGMAPESDPPRVRAPAAVPSLLPLGLVPQRRARRASAWPLPSG